MWLTGLLQSEYPTYLEAAMEMPIEKILPLWQAYLDNVSANCAKNLSLPASQIFNDQTAFENFVKTNGISLEPPAKLTVLKANGN
jgi:hypothetical protein